MFDPCILVAGYDKTRTQNSLAIWDLETSLQSFSTTPVHLRPSIGTEERLSTKGTIAPSSSPQPIQSYFPSESISSIATFKNTNSLVIAGGSTKKVLTCFDLRSPVPSAATRTRAKDTGATTPTPMISGDSSVAFSIPNTKAIWNITTSTLYPHLIASSEDTPGTIVKIWDMRFLRPTPSYLTSSSGHSPAHLSTSPTSSTNPDYTHNGEVCTFDVGRRGGSVVAMRWEPNHKGCASLGVGTRDGGILVFDVVSGELVDDGRGRQEGTDAPTRRKQWTTMTSLRGCKIDHLLLSFEPIIDANTRSPMNRTACRGTTEMQSFAFLPTAMKGKTGLVSVYRNNTIAIEELGFAPQVCLTFASRSRSE